MSRRPIIVRQNKYLNNVIEQDQRGIKKITKATLGFKSLASAEATVVGIELHHMLKKVQYKEAANLPVYEQFYALAA